MTLSKCRTLLGQTVEVKAWVVRKRSSGKIRFLQVRDGTDWLQAILLPDASGLFEVFDRLTTESHIRLKGLVQMNERAGEPEIVLEELECLSLAEPYPITPKEHGIEFLMEHRHLWLRSKRQWAAVRLRSRILNALRQYFEDYIWFDAPILTPSACEGTSTLFETPFFETKAYLSQSGQLYGEVGAFAHQKIVVFGPTFRAEKSRTRKHLAEFWMLEPEVLFWTLKDICNSGQGLVHFVIRYLLENCQEEFHVLERDTKALESYLKPFPIVTYEEAIRILTKAGQAIRWGDDFGAPHEEALGEATGGPLFITHFPAEIKAFYFKRDGANALGADLIAPEGYGEMIGGGERETDLEVLTKRMLEHGLKLEDYQWYLDLRRYGSAPHGGYGLGLERLVCWMAGLAHVRESIPFPRMMHCLKP